ncbi:PAS domain S-box protein [Halovivax gelatinilyticus]|uniref:PAS domain S-box protein n=1 Tax=Halovivax gelatinilyticus TaxID=2961597 RepID=UPI0020CA87FC|nr:PAS domain S-box protein [Halovivax gelatinilyticus]
MQSPYRVLHVDDDHSILDLTANYLERDADRFEVVSATSVADAIDALETEPQAIDCIVSDYELAATDGLSFLRSVRDRGLEHPFVLFSSEHPRAVSIDARHWHRLEFVRKGDVDQLSHLADRIAALADRTRTGRSMDRPLRKLVDQSNDVLWMFDADWEEVRFVNAAVEPIFGIDADALRAEPRLFLSAIHPDDREQTKRAMKRLSAGESVSIEYRVNEADGFSRWVWVNAEPVIDVTGSVEAIVGFSRDITERKRRERALAALNAVAVDLDSLESTEAICERAIEASEQLLNFDLSIIDLEADGYLHKAALSEEIHEAEVTTMSIDEGIAGKTYRTGESMVIDDVEDYPEADPQGPFRSAISIPIGDHGVFQAVDEESNAFTETDLELGELLASHTASALSRIEREGRLHRQNERLDELSRILSHDLRNPLNVVRGSLDLIDEECSSSHLHDAIAATDRMATIIDDTRTLAADGELIDERRFLSLEAVATDCWRTVPTESARLTVAADAHVRADGDRLAHVFENLFRNAVEHGSTSPHSQVREDAVEHGSTGSDDSHERSVTIRVGTFEDGFYVEDDGVGIPDETAESIMEMGVSGNGGTGYGLAIVDRIAEAHGWSVRVTEGSAGGARFEFSDVELVDRSTAV